MATKEQNLKRLDELALILGREPDISGSAAEIAQRVAEWEEEMQSSGDDVQVMNMDIRERENAAHDVREETSGALTRIRVLTCLHLCGVDGETGESVELADVGRVILIMSSDAKHTLMVEWLFMRDFQNAFDAALAGVDSTIVEVMGISAQFTSGAQRGGEVQGVFDDPESLGFASSGIRIEGSSPSLFVRTDTVRAVRRGDTLTINGETFWVDRVSPDDGGSCYLWLNRGQPPAVNRRR